MVTPDGRRLTINADHVYEATTARMMAINYGRRRRLNSKIDIKDGTFIDDADDDLK